MRVSTHQQGTPEWLAERAGIPTASRFADVMATIKSGEAASRKNYRVDLVVERLTGKALPSFQSAAMKQGTEREPDARMAYMVKTGNVVEQVGLCHHDTIACGASPDGLIDHDGGLEIKCPERSAHFDYWQQKAEPPEYTWQIQGCMWVTGRQWWDFVSYNPDFPERMQLIVRRIRRDDAAIAKLEKGILQFIAEVQADFERVQLIQVAA
jgi:putative phage-type endonuclease